MDVQLIGTGGADGWPRPGCRCACCARGRAAGRRRAPAAVLVDGTLRFTAGRGVPDALDAPAGLDGGHVVRRLMAAGC